MRMKSKKNCTTGCPTGGHKSWGECIRSKNLNVSPNVNEGYASKQRAWDKELDSYASARSQGVQPEGTKQHQVDAAMRKAEANG